MSLTASQLSAFNELADAWQEKPSGVFRWALSWMLRFLDVERHGGEIVVRLEDGTETVVKLFPLVRRHLDVVPLESGSEPNSEEAA